MGVDFSMRCCAPLSDKWCEIVNSLKYKEYKDEPISFSARDGIIAQPLFRRDWLRDIGKPCRWESLRQLLDRPVSFEFYDKRSGFDYGAPQIVPCECCFDPKAVLKALEALQAAIQKHDPELPKHCHFRIRLPDGRYHRDCDLHYYVNVLWQGKEYWLDADWSGWGQCLAHASDGTSIDLINRDSIEVEGVVEGPSSQPRVIQGDKPITIEISKQTFAEYFMPHLEEMKQVCRTALRHGWLIFTQLW